MWFFKKMSLKNRIVVAILVFTISLSFHYFVHLFKPTNSIDLYQSISFARDFEKAQMLMLKGYEDNFTEEDFKYLNKLGNPANSISQFTIFEYEDKSYIIMTTPGTPRIQKLKVLAVEELPIEIREYFLELKP
ncbi:hypothetical protein [Bacillus sp. FJAT-45066]|uniref:hypothetical protein n=1 Tax=Bacillus sp. FJAT-45066 TaxID=2011010 RepID=UPI0020D0A2AE|nr:hypothetical protein [Bacillus sp. FJAT-45066]